jgi:hypothetical protein
MKRFLIASAAVTLLALPPVLQATGTAATNPYVARYSLEYYRNDPVPLTALEIRRIEKAAALYARTGTITILPARVAPKAPAPVASAAPASTNCVPAGSAPAIAPLAAPAPAAIIGPTDLELRRQAKADLLFKRTGIRTVLPARNVAPRVAAPVAAPVAAAGVPCAEVPVLAALSPNSGGPLAESIQSGSLLTAPGVPSPNAVPEPGTLGLLGLGLLGLGLSRRKIAKITR